MPVAKTTARPLPTTKAVPASRTLAGCDFVLFARPGIPGDRKRSAGDRRAIDLHPERLDQAAISGNAVALADPDDVSGHEVARRQLDQSAGAFHGDHLRQQVAERGERPFAPRLLPEREQAVDQDDGSIARIWMMVRASGTLNSTNARYGTISGMFEARM